MQSFEIYEDSVYLGHNDYRLIDALNYCLDQDFRGKRIFMITGTEKQKNQLQQCLKEKLPNISFMFLTIDSLEGKANRIT